MPPKKKKGGGAPSVRDCANCGASEGSIPGISVHRFCSRCQITCYCSLKCQKTHWTNGGHKHVCIAPKNRKVSEQPEPKKAAAKGEECCICLEEMTEKETIKLDCGHSFHLDCIQQLKEKGVQQLCPLCRANLPDSPEKMFSEACQIFFQLSKIMNEGGPINSHKKNKLEKMIKLWENAANYGHVHAQYNIAMLYYNGNGVPKDYSKAFKWYTKSANQGFMMSQYNLGFMYQEGEGVTKSESLALEWYQKAADQGFVPSYNQIGGIYSNKQGLLQNYLLAVKWYLKGSKKGIPESQFNLGSMYLNGKGVSMSVSKAAKWYLKAAEQGHSQAQYFLGLLFQGGEGIPKNDSDALLWLQKAAEQGLADAQNHLGLMYITGTGVPMSLKEAFRYLKQASDQGSKIAQDNMMKIINTTLEEKENSTTK